MFINGDQWLIVVLNWITLWKSNMASWKVHEQNGGWHEDICGLCIFSDIHYGWGIDGSSSKSKSTVLQQSQKDKRVTNPTKIANGTLSIIWRWICFFLPPHQLNPPIFLGQCLSIPIWVQNDCVCFILNFACAQIHNVFLVIIQRTKICHLYTNTCCLVGLVGYIPSISPDCKWGTPISMNSLTISMNSLIGKMMRNY